MVIGTKTKKLALVLIGFVVMYSCGAKKSSKNRAEELFEQLEGEEGEAEGTAKEKETEKVTKTEPKKETKTTVTTTTPVKAGLDPALRHKWQTEMEMFGMTFKNRIEFFEAFQAEEIIYVDDEVVMHVKSKVEIVGPQITLTVTEILVNDDEEPVKLGDSTTCIWALPDANAFSMTCDGETSLYNKLP